MTLKPQFLRDIIKFSLYPLNLWAENTEKLLTIICAHESILGSKLKQTNGPALGLYGMEPATLRDQFNTFLYRSDKKDLFRRVSEFTGVGVPDEGHCQYNPIYSTVIARVKLLRDPHPIPDKDDIVGLCEYAKRVWNGPGKATAEKYENDYRRLILKEK
ncbi:MAG TPA: hypothetical protein VKA08_16440 [Balneolales bacterium]|nr:hypothetical protein [Balneolales bacterium]